MVSVKSKYAIAALFELTLNETDKPMQSRAISEARAIPHGFLESVLVELRKAGFVISTRGAHGGYRLAKPASQIKLNAVVTAIDGPLSCSKTYNGGPTLTKMWEEFETQINSLLNISLESLVKDKQKAEKMLTYII